VPYVVVVGHDMVVGPFETEEEANLYSREKYTAEPHPLVMRMELPEAMEPRRTTQ
jgi:hypothetical protein